jgi:hypothetical protein
MKGLNKRDDQLNRAPSLRGYFGECADLTENISVELWMLERNGFLIMSQNYLLPYITLKDSEEEP